jgi:hypothetical protein
MRANITLIEGRSAHAFSPPSATAITDRVIVAIVILRPRQQQQAARDRRSRGGETAIAPDSPDTGLIAARMSFTIRNRRSLRFRAAASLDNTECRIPDLWCQV